MKPKIIHLLSSNKLSGAERIAINIMTQLRDRYEFFYCSPDGPIREVLCKSGINFIPINNISVSQVKRVNLEVKPDIIHAHDYRASVIAAFARPKAAIISHLHANNPNANYINPKILLYGLSSFFFQRIIVVSRSVLSESILRPLIQSKTKIIYNAINPKVLKELSCKYKAEKSDLLFIGRLANEKGPLDFINLVYKLGQYHPIKNCIMIGDGVLRDECEKKINELNLQDKVKLLGFLDNPYPYLASTKVVVIPSKWEGFGLIAVEAMLLGKPVIASCVGGLKEIIQDGKNGYLCDREDVFVERAKELLESSCILEVVGRESEKRAESINQFNNFVQSFISIYESAIGGSSIE